MKKKLSTLLNGISVLKHVGDRDITISGLTENSRLVKPGFLFVAVRGVLMDAHQFIPQAIDNGAVAIVGEEDPEKLELKHTTYIQVPDSRKALGFLASNWYDNPSEKLTVIGVTGTDGKTTTVNLLYAMLRQAKRRVSMISTVNAKINGRAYETGLHTTNPDALPLQKLLSLMVKKQQEIAILETTSEGIAQERVAGVKYHMAIITNITPEHLNYHKTFENYRDTKARLFENTEVNILNADDPSYDILKNKTQKGSTILSYSITNKTDLYASDITMQTKGMHFLMHEHTKTIPFTTKLTGTYNIQNILAAATAARSLGVTWEDIQSAVKKFTGITGRMEIMQEKPVRVLVDFAHTTNALEQALTTVRKTTKGKLIVVFGCAGQRDATKRPEMARVATRLADMSIFTLEDPRHEPLTDIFDQMVSGVVSDKYNIIEDRGEAIEQAITQAQPGDTVIICGKGHEKSLAYRGVEYPWSDQEAVKKILKGEKVRLQWK